jgi:cyclopropane fatty-acyl-phospholipid synthase-like methyltransferase
MNRATGDPTIHYEDDPAFFESFLDPYLKYGSGYFLSDDEPLAPAALRMLDRAVDAGRIPPAGTVLDVGSGWGSMTRRLRERLPAVRYHHVNPTARQREYIARRFGDAERTFAGPVETAALPERTYDAIFFSDSLCHIRDRVEVLRRARQALVPGGRMVVQNNFFLSEELHRQHQDARATQYVQDEVFGFAEITALATFAREADQAGLRMVELEDISRHYLRTVAAWLHKLAPLDPRRFAARDRCIRYLTLSASGFDYSICEQFIVLQPLTPSSSVLKKNLSLMRSR